MHKLVLAVLATAILCAAQSPAAGTEATPGSLPAMGKPAVIDFNVPLKPYKQSDLKFSLFRKRPAVIIYFSPTCGHCRHTYPHIQALQKQYESKGIAFVAIASGTSTNEDMADFDAQFKLTMPTFRDQDKVFSAKYGTGSVPLILLVDHKGAYRYWNGSDDATLRGLDSAVKAAAKR